MRLGKSTTEILLQQISVCTTASGAHVPLRYSVAGIFPYWEKGSGQTLAVYLQSLIHLQ